MNLTPPLRVDPLLQKGEGKKVQRKLVCVLAPRPSILTLSFLKERVDAERRGEVHFSRPLFSASNRATSGATVNAQYGWFGFCAK